MSQKVGKEKGMTEKEERNTESAREKKENKRDGKRAAETEDRKR